MVEGRVDAREAAVGRTAHESHPAVAVRHGDAQPGGAADLMLDPIDARHLAERILLAAGEVETAAEEEA